MKQRRLKPLFRAGLALLAAFALCSTAYAHSYATAVEKGHPGGIPAKGYAVMKEGGKLEPFEFTRPPVGDDDILIEILYAGICHSDIHHVKGEWKKENYPLVPGHEVVGRVVQVGKHVTQFKVGDIAGVGCMIDACGKCEFCLASLEQFCINGATMTYGEPGVYGGYSTNLVVKSNFALRIPEGIPVELAAPLLCAGVTTYSPLKALNIQKGQKVAVAGLGGLGHMALQYARSMGADVTVFEITDAKADSARKLGASHYVNTAKDKNALAAHKGRFDVIISTIASPFEIDPYVATLKSRGTIVLLGVPPAGKNKTLLSMPGVILGGKRVMGSVIGGIAETQEMLDYSAGHQIYPMVEIIPIQEVNEAYEKVVRGEVQFRYVIDMASLK